ncbi:transglutaminase-like domain-containing protein [Chitinolyticbacter albus]|uniref:transglutaminase-like domain-containing protein n=1 Tax=Chitinolyticbacter albus TaxID=2961951 RepID=UPI00210D3DC7|nr:transglutaminase family protein [Chitinolyticbacter albus]
MHSYLQDSEVLDFTHPAVAALAVALRRDTVQASAQAAFEWVRDEIVHCNDAGREEVPVSASETLAIGTGFCFAKSHLLVALLRANGIAAGLCYQRLTVDGPTPPHCLHGLVAIALPEHGWYRCDPRGNTRPGVNAQFTPGVERLAYPVLHAGECLYPGIHAQPLPELVAYLRSISAVSEYRKAPFDLVPPPIPQA